VAITTKQKIVHEFEQKRRAAALKAANNKADAYRTHPELADYDKQISNVATAYTKRMIAGDDVSADMQKDVAKIIEQKNTYLKSLGIDPASFEPEYSCKVCNDTGSTKNGVCDCFKARVIEENFKNSNLSKILQNQSFENFDLGYYPDEIPQGYPISPRANMEQNLKKCKEFAYNFDFSSKSVLMTGGTGLGKTYL
jgi:DNA replication protein DnaC